MSDNNPKNPDETPKNKITKDYGDFGKLEMIDITDELINYDILGGFLGGVDGSSGGTSRV